MTSSVKLRKPRNVLGGTYSGNRQIGRPKSWTEFNTRFQAATGPINIDITPVPKADQEIMMREPSVFRKVRPKSASLLDEGLSISDCPGSNPGYLTHARPASPKYKSFMVPNPWRMTSNKPNAKSPSQSDKGLHHLEPNEESSNYDETTSNYGSTNKPRNAAEDARIENNPPKATKAETNTRYFYPKMPHSASFSDSDSFDSAVVVSAEASSADSNLAHSSEKSPKWKASSTNEEFGDLDTSSTISQSTERDTQPDILKQEGGGETEIILSRKLTIIDKSDQPGYKGSENITTLTLSAPKIYISVDKREEDIGQPSSMEHYQHRQPYGLDLLPDEHVHGEKRSTVPSPLKSCYAPIATYDIPLDEYLDDSEDESASEVSRSNISCHGYDADKSAEEYMTPKPRPRQTSFKSLPRQSPASLEDDRFMQTRRLKSNETDEKTGNPEKIDNKSGTWPRRRVKKKEETVVDTEELMRRFRKTRETHLARFRNIYADSRKRMDDVMRGLERSMTEHGYREWYPRIR